MQGNSIRSDIERAAATADGSRQRSAPMPRQKPYYSEPYNPNWDNVKAGQWLQENLEKGFQAGKFGTNESDVLRRIEEVGPESMEGMHLRRGYEAGYARRKKEDEDDGSIRERRRLIRRQGHYTSPFKY